MVGPMDPSPLTAAPPTAASSGAAPIPALPAREAVPDRPVRRSLPAQVADAITRAVLEGRFPPGTTLPAERELAAMLGINRTSLRQAVARLEQAGLVEPRQGIGTVVLDPLGANDAAVVLQALVAAGPDIVDEVLLVRRALAGLAGELAAGQAPSAGTDLLGGCFARVTAAEDPAALQSSELAFFSALVEATGNRPLQVMMRWLEELYGATAPLFQRAFDDHAAVEADLEAIVRGVTGGDRTAAREAVDAYAARSGERLRRAVREGLDPPGT